ncbi:MAG: 5-oxoprolinase/urea amidolyase family protein [Bowdeniella nasicola]|nr:5-oxoprolinase/urea amidolyase family protein [Bowdeniella nasicola]
MSVASRKIVSCGDLAFLVELDSLSDVLALHAALKALAPPEMVECVAAAKTVLISASTPVAASELAALVRTMEVPAFRAADAREVQLPVCYDGEDLTAVATMLNWSVDHLIHWHTSTTWTAAFGGFAPGFTYCIGEGPDIARRDTPRTQVPAGAVGLAGHYSAVYPRATPGGWQLIGHCGEPMWDAQRTPPALIAPGDRIRYRAVRERVELPAAKPTQAGEVTYGVQVRASGIQSLLQDQGRRGHADLGVCESGAMDLRSARRANVLVGNQTDEVVIEHLLGGLQLQARGDLVVAVTGAQCELEVTGGALHPDVDAYHPEINTPFALLDGQCLRLGAPSRGVRSYVAIRGGICAERILGSAATDLLSGQGPAPLRAGDELAVAEPQWPSFVADAKTAPALPRDVLAVSVILGPRDDWFSADDIDSLLTQQWQVTERSNRIGLRLDGIPLGRHDRGELASEGTVAGAIQIPPDGKPVLFMRDHPVTGGYPVIGVVNHHDLDQLAQLAPGAKIRFRLYHAPSVADDAIGLGGKR